MTQDDAFLAAIIDAPHDDNPRQVYADWLQEQGRSDRAEFIRLQITLARMPAGDRRRKELETRVRALRAKHKDEWVEQCGQPMSIRL